MWSGKSGSTARACPQRYQSEYFMKQSPRHCLFNFFFSAMHLCRGNINEYDCGILSVGHEFINKMWFPGWQLCTYSSGILENLLWQALNKILCKIKLFGIGSQPLNGKNKFNFMCICRISTHLYSIKTTQFFMKNCQCFVTSAYL